MTCPAESDGANGRPERHRLYGLDGDALRAIAADIGAPTLEDLATPIDAVPEGASVTAFRSGAGGWS